MKLTTPAMNPSTLRTLAFGAVSALTLAVTADAVVSTATGFYVWYALSVLRAP